MKSNQNYTGLEVAIIGIACRFPGARNWREFWKNLVNGVESIEFFSQDQLREMGADQKWLNDKNFVPARVVLQDKDLFDYTFFNYSPSEALLLNPAHRIFHECVWEALEDAGCNPDKTQGPIGLYAGAGDDFNWKTYSQLENITEGVDYYTLATIHNKDYLSSLIAYKLNLQGPSYVVNTACSTSLVAVNLACKSLLFGENKIALAGGVSVNTKPQNGYLYEDGLIFSPDGHCRAFDKDAAGTVAGEGAGVVVLKRLQDAINDGDHIYAVIKGSALSNDGNRKVGYTAPSVEGQVECLRKAQVFAQVQPDSISYVEAHGTGTKLGDPIELEALNIAFNRNLRQRCALGSVKTNFGHLDTAAGVAGLIKTALALKYKQLPPSLHFKEPNPGINFKDGPFYVNTTTKAWERTGELPLRAAVSSLGIGGTNAHAILEEAPVQQSHHSSRSFHLLTLSANNPASLLRYLERLKEFVTGEEPLNLADMAYTCQVGRKHFAYRLPLVCSSPDQLKYITEDKNIASSIVRSREMNGRAAFLFTGQGSQYADMCKDLYEKEPYFREWMDKGFLITRELTGTDLRTILFAGATDPGKINETRYAQPLLFLIEYALARYLLHIGITPVCMIGHSIGEYAAACIANVFSFEDALRIVTRRGELMFSLPAGAMLSIPLAEKEAVTYVSDGISLAVVNGPEQVVLSGSLDAVEKLKQRLDQEKIPYVVLHTSHAFHSAMQDPIMPEFKKAFENTRLNKPGIPFISNLTGKLITNEQACSADYWVQQMRNTVRFSDGIKTLLAVERDLVFIEAGPGRSLVTLLQQYLHEASRHYPCVNLVRSIKEAGDDAEYLLKRIGQLWAAGLDIDWEKYHAPEKRRKTPLPTYSFEPLSYPAEVNPFAHPLIEKYHKNNAGRYDLKECIYHPFWKRTLLQGGPVANTKRNFLLFSGHGDFSRPLREKLENDGHHVVEIFTGDEYLKRSDKQFCITPSVKEHFLQLADELRLNGFTVTDLIYSWPMAADAGISPHRNNSTLYLCYVALASIMQALLQTDDLKGKKIWVVTNALHKITGIEKSAYPQSLALGLVNVLPQEFSVSCFNIDIDIDEPVDCWLPQFIHETNIEKDKKDRLVAFRHGQRWVQDFQQQLHAVQKGSTLIKREAVYLVTGGLGNLGMLMARWLARDYKAKVAVIGRRALTSLKDASVQAYLALREAGLKINYYQADVTDAEQLEGLVAGIETTWGPVHGVIHAAGITDTAFFELVEDVTAEKTQAMFDPKVKGIETLDLVFSRRKPAFIWVSSSVASVLGGLGFGAYSAANLYMEHFISSKTTANTLWKCIGLAEMEFDYKNVSVGSDALYPHEIVNLLEWSLECGAPVIVQTKRLLAERLHTVYEVKKERYLNDKVMQQPAGKRERPDLRTEYAEPGSVTEQQLKTVFENFLGVNNIGVNDNFFELGGDSLKGMMLLKRIRKEFDINMVLADFFKRQTIRDIAIFIDDIRAVTTETKRARQIVV